jgi:hypothetical protein
MTRAFAILAALAGIAVAEPDFGEPLSGPTAYPALASLTPYTMSFGMMYVPSLPPIDLGNGITAPRGSATYLAFESSSAVGGLHPGWFGYYSVSAGLALQVAGDATRSFQTGGQTFTDGSTSAFSIAPLAPGMGYRTRELLFGAQVVPRIEWFTESFHRDAMTVSGRDHFYTLAADLQGCLQYNLFGFMAKNSAICAYVAPVIYRDGWFSGASIGVRWYPL